MATVEIVHGSLLDQSVEVIVNAANTMMRGGGGIDGMIHQKAGQRLLWELQKVAPKGCPTGEVVVTAGHDLPFKAILHTPGPIWRGGAEGEAELLQACYRNSLAEADRLGVASIGFCSISTGAYRYPLPEAAEIALTTAYSWHEVKPDSSLERIVFALWGREEYAAFCEAFLHLNEKAP
ncbi:MAG: macro domain-containing protein [Fimbriimonadaceae bacterium]|nr:macro domain-containing protein [Fimbriimonadaceae bacterium]